MNENIITPKTKDELNAESNQGLNFFRNRFPQLDLQIKYTIPMTFKSPFNSEQSTLSIFYSEIKKKWMFKDHGGKGHFGDMYSFVAFLHKLDFKRNFKIILKIIEEELKYFNPKVEDSYTIKNSETGEYITLLNNDDVKLTIPMRSYPTVQVTVPIKVVEQYSKLEKNKLVKYENNATICINECKNLFFYIVKQDQSVITWGNQPLQYFLGYKQSLEIAHFYTPINKANLVLCENVMDVLAFLSVGIAAIKVNPATVWENPYFNHIICSTFSNLIVSYDASELPKNMNRNHELRFFDLKNYLLEKDASLIDYIWCNHDEADFLEPLWDLYEFVDDDNLILEQGANNIITTELN